MSFYGNIIKSIKENFFSTFSFNNNTTNNQIPKNFSINARFNNDELIVNSDGKWIQFDKDEKNLNAVQINHGPPQEGKNNILKEITYFQKNSENQNNIISKYSEGNKDIDISLDGQQITITTAKYDETGHLNTQTHEDILKVNIDSEKNIRQIEDGKLLDNINTEKKRIDILCPEGQGYPTDRNSSIREIAIDVANFATSDLTERINENRQYITNYANESLKELQNYADETLAYRNSNLEKEIKITGNIDDNNILHISFVDLDGGGI